MGENSNFLYCWSVLTENISIQLSQLGELSVRIAVYKFMYAHTRDGYQL